MLSYAYKILTKDNALKEGSVKALTQRSARKKLEANGSTIVLVRRESDIKNQEISLPLKRFSLAERIFFFRNLALMTSAGVSPASGVRILSEQLKYKAVQKDVDEMAQQIEDGNKISDAMRSYPEYFSEYLVESVKVGEVTGELARTFDRISTDMEHAYDLRRKVVGAIAYPVVVIIVMFAAAALLGLYVLPQIAQLFDELNVVLPLPTRILLGVSGYFYQHPHIPILISVGTIMAGVLIYRTKRGRYAIHASFLKTPIFGKLVREYNIAQLFRTTESLFGRGVSLVNAVAIAEKTLKNDVYRQALQTVHPVLIHGGKMTDAMEPFPKLFPRQLQKIIGVGERTGKIEESLDRIATHYERSVDHRTQMMSSLIEPALMIVVGLAVGFLAVSIFLPLYNGALFDY